MEYEERLSEMRRMMEELNAWQGGMNAMLIKLRTDAPPAASDSPSQSEKPSEPSTCEAGESAPAVEAADFHREGMATVQAAFEQIQSAPRKVWAVQLGRVVEGVFSSKDAANRHLGGVRFPVDSTITEYEVHEDEVADD